MVVYWVQLISMLFIILISAQLFSNALEYLGHKLEISEGVTGSIFAAIATALPETLVPVLAIVAGGQNQHVNEEISVGAILGAPLMLSTLSMFCMSIFILDKRPLTGYLRPEKVGYQRDVDFFILAYALSMFAMFLGAHEFYPRIFISCLLVGVYVVYLYQTLKASSSLVQAGHGVKPLDPLYATRLGFRNSTNVVVLQLIVGLGLLIVGAKGFINGIEHLSVILQLSPLVLSFIIVPLATELPEKVNSVLWVRKNKDTLGVGNITGALIFQSALLPPLGIMLTPWQLTTDVIPGVIITAIAALWLRFISFKNGIPILAIFINGALYFTYLYWIFTAR